MNQYGIMIGAAILLAGTAQPACADSTSGSMSVSATVTQACRTNAGELSFGSTDTDRLDARARSVLSLTCTPGTAYNISLDEGRNGNRAMLNTTGTASLAYDIYQDAAGGRRWGAGVDGVSGTAPATGQVVLAAYGRLIETGAASGDYSDTVTITVGF